MGPDAAHALTHLIMVPGHAITSPAAGAKQLGGSDAEKDDAWYLLDYQRQHDVGLTLVSFIILLNSFAAV